MCQVSDADVRVLLERTAHLVTAAEKQERNIAALAEELHRDHDVVTRLNAVVEAMGKQVCTLIARLEKLATDKQDKADLDATLSKLLGATNTGDAEHKSSKYAGIYTLLAGAGSSGVVIVVVWAIAKAAGWI